VKTSATRWQRKSCNDTTLTEQTFSDSTCTTVVSTRQPLPVNTCGSISASDGSTQGVFFSCASLSAPPTLSNQNNDVFSEFLYLPDSSGPSCNISNTYQVASYQSNVCITGGCSFPHFVFSVFTTLQRIELALDLGKLFSTALATVVRVRRRREAACSMRRVRPCFRRLPCAQSP
jgi:hypothetical protein